MKRALDEGAAFGRLPSMAGVGNSLFSGYPDSNSTPFTLRSKDSSESPGSSYNASFTPRLTLRQFRQFQLSPVLSSPPDPDYKRVRRKKSLIQLNKTSLGFASSSPQTTSSLPSSYTTSLQNFLPSPQPPTYSTPVPRPRTRAPSLSSTVDTLQSTPLRTPIQQGGSDLEQWREFERSKLPEPLRTKRKFPLFKQAKRLPHSNNLEEGGSSSVHGEIWEVHAVVVDSGGFVSVGSSDALERSGANVPQSIGKKGSSVRFKGIDENISREESRGLASLRSGEKKESSLSSSFSLSKFTFPEPPGQRLGGTFEQQGEPTSPASPATLHYRGASFDVVNPHESLILGSSEIETPAEIDGLLDDYFGSRSTLSEMQPYDNFTGEMSASQTSLPTNSSNGRQRVLYDDVDSARRRIMAIEAQTGPRANDNGPYQQSPLANRGRGRWLEGSALWPQSHPGMMWHGLEGQDERDDVPGPEQMQHHLAEAVHRSAATRLYDRNDGFEDVPITEAYDTYDVHDDDNEDSPEGGNEDAARDRGSSLYPHSQRSDPFDLTVSDLDDNESRFNNIDEVMSRNWLPPYAGRNAGAYNPEIHPIHEDEDVAEAQATQNPYEAETTIGEIVSHYNYERPPLFPRRDDEEADLEPSSGSLEDRRGFTGRYDIFEGQSSSPYFTSPPSSYDDSGRTARSQHRGEIFDLHRRATARRDGPPRMPAPTPPQSVIESRARQFPHQYSDLPTTDQTYGSTGRLLSLTPHQQLQLTGDLQQRTNPHSDLYRIGSQGYWSSKPLRQVQQYTEDEDKENAPPVPRVPQMPSGLTVPAALQRSSSIYSKNDGDWQTERSESHQYLVDASGGVHTGALRRSEESRADTSAYSLDPRFSYPNQPVPGVAGFHQTHQQTVGMHDNAPRVFEPEGAVSGREKGKQPVRSTSQGDTPGAEGFEHADKEINPPAIKRAVKFVSERLRITPPKGAYGHTTGANRALQLGSLSEAHQSASSDRQGLLQHTGMPFASPGLRWSDTNHTFLTSPRTPVGPTMPYSPLGSMPHNQTPITPPSTAMVLRNRAATELSVNPRHGTPTMRDIELQHLRGHKPRRVSRAAMSSQTELRPLELADSVTGALTAAELEEAQHHWTNEPQRNALARLVEDQNGFVIVQNDGTIERVNTLMRPNEARLISFRREQRMRTAPYFHACVLCPITSLAFGLGGLDWRMKQITKGKITEMSPSAKKQALQVYTMLSLIAWMFLGIVIAILIVAIN